MQKTKLPVGACLLIALVMGVSGCAAKPAGLSDQQVTAMTENILRALDENNYPAFVAKFSEQMNSAFSQEQFTSLRNLLQESSGKFVAIGKWSLSNRQGFVNYRIPCEYELENIVVTITFKIGGSQIEGLYFTSPNLRKISQ